LSVQFFDAWLYDLFVTGEYIFMPELIKPERSELSFRRKMLENLHTMSWLGHTISFPVNFRLPPFRTRNIKKPA
jgi:hypothetical protein